jgi:hypothetical protein
LLCFGVSGLRKRPWSKRRRRRGEVRACATWCGCARRPARLSNRLLIVGLRSQCAYICELDVQDSELAAWHCSSLLRAGQSFSECRGKHTTRERGCPTITYNARV